MIGTAIAFLTGPLGRVLLITLLALGVWLHGRMHQHRLDDQAHAAEVAAIAASNARNLEAAGRMSTRVSLAHATFAAGVARQTVALRGEVAAARLLATITPRTEIRHADSPASATPAAPTVVDIDDLLFGPDFLSLWNRAYSGAGAQLPGAGQPAAPLRPPAAPGRGPPSWRDAAGAAGQAHRGCGPGADLCGSG